MAQENIPQFTLAQTLSSKEAASTAQSTSAFSFEPSPDLKSYMDSLQASYINFNSQEQLFSTYYNEDQDLILKKRKIE